MAEPGEMSVALLVVAGSAGMFALIVFLLFYMAIYQRKISRHREARQQDLLAATIAAQEAERKRIAKDLHEDIQQQVSYLSSAILHIDRNQRKGKPAPATLKEVAAQAEKTVEDIRRISHNLLPDTMKKWGLAQGLKHLCNRLNETGMEATFSLEGEYNRLETGVELALFRVVQELVNNTDKHAEATKIEMRLSCLDGRLELCVSDNGKGFDAEAEEQKKSGLGMRNIESRLSTINARYSIESGPGKGTTARVVMETHSEEGAGL